MISNYFYLSKRNTMIDNAKHMVKIVYDVNHSSSMSSFVVIGKISGAVNLHHAFFLSLLEEEEI